MEEQEQVDPNYLKGFNEGYTVALYAPELAEKLTTVGDDTPRNSGFKAGREQLLAEKEINRNLLPQWLRPLNDREQSVINPARTKGRNIEPDKD